MALHSPHELNGSWRFSKSEGIIKIVFSSYLLIGIYYPWLKSIFGQEEKDPRTSNFIEELSPSAQKVDPKVNLIKLGIGESTSMQIRSLRKFHF